ncbi:hypothetical protein AB0H49_23810 [Nocardia sp. NPDC050713]|uniref:hypothetical protein n=1 Tax=unclassified Nocardia TaxID=2637762 RepID=UPI0033A57ABA
MKRISVIVLAAGAVALAATGCGGSDESSDASGLRKGSTGTSASATQAPTTTVSAPTTPDSAPATTESADTSGLGPASRTTCGEFKELDGEAEKRVIEQILAENPESSFAGSPNVALGTAKLVCLSPSNADKPVAVAARII